MKKQLTYYPGCSAHGTSKEFEYTVKMVMKKTKVEVNEIPDWNCCGASSIHTLSDTLSVLLPMRNLVLAQKLKNSVIATPCASCYSRLKLTKHTLDNNKELQIRLGDAIEEGKYNGSAEVKSILQFIYEDIGLEEIKKYVVRPLTGLKVACYYGCLLTRPANITQFDSPEYPVSMDKIIEALGATAVPFDFKTECCGASLSISATNIVHDLTGKILQAVKATDADVIATGCPLCQSNLDMRQHGAGEARNTKFNIPVVYFTQLMAVAFGYDPSEMMFDKNFVAVQPIFDKIFNKGAEVPALDK